MEDLKTLIDNLARDQHLDGAGAKGPVREGLARAVLGLTHREAERVLRRSILRNQSIDQGCVQEALSQKQQIVRKSGMLEYCRRTIDFTGVGGLDRLKLWFGKRRQAFSTGGARFGLRPPKGVVLVGVPGCGKSLSAKALASEWDVPLLRLDFGNDISRLPPEFIRKGRFDEVFFVGLPKEKERQEIIKVHLKKRNREPGRFDINHLIEKSKGYSGAEIEEAVISGLYRAFSDKERELETNDETKSLEDIVPLSQSRADEMIRIQRWAAENARAAS